MEIPKARLGRCKKSQGVDEFNTEEATVPPNYAAVGFSSFLQDDCESIGQVFDVTSCGETSTAG